MKSVSIKLFSFALASMLVASCSDSNSDSTTNPDLNPNLVGVNVNSNTNAEELAKSVLNFKAPKTRVMKAAGATAATLGDVYSMPAKPAVPADAIEVYDHWVDNDHPSSLQLPWSDKKKSYIVKKGTKITSGLCLNGHTLYVEGEVVVDNTWGNNNGKLILLDGGKATFNMNNGGNLFNSSTMNFYNYGGTFTYTNPNSKYLSISSNDAFYSDTDLNIGDKILQVQGKLYVGGKVTAGGFEPQKGSMTNIQGGFDGLENVDLSIEGTVNIDGNITCNNLTIGGDDGKLWLCSANVKNAFTMNSNNAESHISYIKANRINHFASGKIYLVDNSVVECNTYWNEYNGQGANFVLRGDNAKALFKTQKLQFNEGGRGGDDIYHLYMFNAENTGGKIYVDAGQYDYIDNEHNVSIENLSATKSVEAVGSGVELSGLGNANLKLDDTDVACGYHITPDNPTPTPPTGEKELEEISNITYSHDHNISATCIQPYNGKMYMSYHTRGGLQGGCIEVFKTENDQTTLLQFIEDADHNYDYNHLMVDPTDKKVYVVGNSNKKGAMLGRIDILESGLLNADARTEQTEQGENIVMPLEVLPYDKNAQKYDKNDENCIVRDGNRLIVATTKGLVTYNAETLEPIEDVELNGKAKHVAMLGNKIATLNYTTRPGDENATVAGEIREFNAGGSISSPTATYSVGNVTPNNGKNTVAIDGTKTYVCRSAEGLTCFENGNEVWTWKAPLTLNSQQVKGYCNGVTYDSNYIYVACGGYGLVVLDKNNFENGVPKVVARKKCATLNSANYVTLDNGYIYVAYGQSRLRVFKLVDKK